MYPETDIPPIPISKERLERLRAKLPEKPEKKRARLVEAGMSEDLADQMVRDASLPLFENVMSKVKVDATLVANTLVNSFRSLRRAGVDADALTEDQIVQFFKELSTGGIVKQEIDSVLTEMARGKRPLTEILGERQRITEDDLRRIVEAVLAEKWQLLADKGERSFGPIMGEVMKHVRGKIDGALVGKVLKELMDGKLRAKRS
jgi:glutamyl-tRNA(Gln) amidotransferase subunit E